jgi:uncharacterized membrane protein
MSSGHGARGVSTRSVEITVAILVLALGALVVFDSLRLGAKWGSDGPEAGYFPFYIGLILCVCSAVLLVYAMIGKVDGPKLFVSFAKLGQVARVLIPAALYVLGIQLVGIYVASVLYVAIFMVWLGRYSIALSLLISVAVMAAFYVTFERWFKVPLYKGLWDVLSFLGH